jgi:AraC-like DNA-binding protein
MFKRDGFEGQQSIVLPNRLIESLENNLITQSLYFTDIGFYPDAKSHFRKRPNGSGQHILIYCYKGEGWVSIENKKVRLKKNQYVFIPKETPHSYASSNVDPWSIFWVHFVGKYSELFLLNQGFVKFNPKRLELFYNAYRIAEEGYSEQNLIFANSYLQQFLLSFKFSEKFDTVKTETKTGVVANSILFMKDNLSKNLKLKELASQSKLSISQYSNLFKQKTSNSPLDFFINLKLQYACKLLDNSDLRINEIAIKLGYIDAFYFSRLFKKFMGVSPKEYRQQGAR